MSETANGEDIGERLREARRAKGWTLDEAARRARIGRSTLSKIENGQSRPGFEVLRRLTEALGLGGGQLFAPSRRAARSGVRDVTRSGAGAIEETPTYRHELLADQLAAKAMIPYKSRIKARSPDDFDDWVRHDGEEFVLVLEGAVELRLEHYRPQILEKGDSAYYDAAMGHMLISVSQEDALVVWVTLTG